MDAYKQPPRVQRLAQSKPVHNAKFLIFASAAIFLSVAALIILYFSALSEPAQLPISLYPDGAHESGWRYYDAGGNVGHEVYDDYGYLCDIADVDPSAFAADYVLSGELPNAQLYFEYVSELISVYLDGTLLYSDLPDAPAEALVFLSPEADAFSAEPRMALVSLPEDYAGRTLTVVTYFAPELYDVPFAFTAYPTLRNDQAVISLPLSGAVKPMALCGALAAATAAILAMLVYGALSGAAQWPSVLLALYLFGSLVKCGYGSETAMYSIGTNMAAHLLSACSVSFLLLFYACYMRRGFRITLLCAALLNAAAITALTVYNAAAGLYYEANYTGWLEFFVLALFFVFSVFEWRAKKNFFRTGGHAFLALSGVYLLLMAGAYLLLPGTDAGAQFFLPFSSLLYGYPRGMNSLLSGGVAIAGITALFLRFLRDSAALRAEREALTLKNELMLSNLQSFEASMQKTEEQRHELSHHAAALQVLLANGETEQAKAYLHSLSQTMEKTAVKRYTENIIVNAIVNDAAAKAERLGVRFETDLAVAPVLKLPDSALCSLLYNMLDNALRANEAVAEGQRRIYLKLHSKDSFLAIVCTNANTGGIAADEDGNIRSTRRDSAGHGYGIPIMRKICETYHSVLLVEYTEDSFTVRTNLRIPD